MSIGSTDLVRSAAILVRSWVRVASLSSTVTDDEKILIMRYCVRHCANYALLSWA